MQTSEPRRCIVPARQALALVSLLVSAVTAFAAVPPPSVDWNFKGRLEGTTQGGEPAILPWNESGTDGAANLDKIKEFMNAEFHPNSSFESPHRLQAGPSILSNLGLWTQAQVIGQTVSRYSDNITVATNSVLLGRGFLELTWSVDGKFTAETTKFGNGPMGWTYYQTVELFAVSSATGRVPLYKKDFQNADVSPGAMNFTDFITAVRIDSSEEQHILEERTVGTGTLSRSLLVPFTAGTPVDLEYSLFAGINLAALNVDFTGHVTFLEKADFHNTARLVSFRVLDENMNVTNAPYTLMSEAGLSYDNLTPVPEPSTVALLLASLLVLAAKFGHRRRHDSHAVLAPSRMPRPRRLP